MNVNDKEFLRYQVKSYRHMLCKIAVGDDDRAEAAQKILNDRVLFVKYVERQLRSKQRKERGSFFYRIKKMFVSN